MTEIYMRVSSEITTMTLSIRPSLLEDQTDYISDLEAIMDSIEHLEYGTLASYHTKMRGLIARMRRNVSRPTPLYVSRQQATWEEAPAASTSTSASAAPEGY